MLQRFPYFAIVVVLTAFGSGLTVQAQDSLSKDNSNYEKIPQSRMDQQAASKRRPPISLPDPETCGRSG